MQEVKAIQVVLVSPGDVADEQSAVEEAIQWARQIASGRGVTFDFRHWTDLPPGYHPDGPQALIDEGLAIDHCDLLIGIFWKRFGVVDDPPYSRTAREILRALEARKANSTRPDIKVYFSKRPYFPTAEELEQQALVLKFKEELEKSIIYHDYIDLVEFRFRVFADLIECVWKVIGVRDLTDFQPSVEVSSDPILLRYESLNDCMPDINLKISGTVPPAWAGDAVSLSVDVFFNAMCTNRITEDGTTDAVLTTGGVDGTVVSGGKRVPDTGPTFGISFKGVGLKIKESNLDEDLSIRGIRGTSLSVAGSPLRAIVAVTLEKDDRHTSILPRQVILGLPVDACQFFARRTSDDLERVNWPVPGADSLRMIRFFTVHFREAFPGAFKTREELARWSPGAADHGDVLMISSSIPPHFDIFVTVQDLPTASPPANTARALAVKIDYSGRLLSRVSELSLPVWHRWEWVHIDWKTEPKYTDTQTRMVHIVRETHDFRTGWELVRGAGNTQQETELVFGVVLVGPRNICPPKKIKIDGTLAPISHFMIGGHKPLPCFKHSYQIFDLVLETSDEPFDPVETEREKYIAASASSNPELLAQEINRDSFEAYLLWRFPGLRVEVHPEQLDLSLNHINRSKYKVLKDLDSMIAPWYPRTGEIPRRLETYLKSRDPKIHDPSASVRNNDCAALRFSTLLSIADIEFRDSLPFSADWTKYLVKQFTDMYPLSRV